MRRPILKFQPIVRYILNFHKYKQLQLILHSNLRKIIIFNVCIQFVKIRKLHIQTLRKCLHNLCIIAIHIKHLKNIFISTCFKFTQPGRTRITIKHFFLPLYLLALLSSNIRTLFVK